MEGAVKIMYTRIYAPLRKTVFHSLKELNEAIRIELEAHNNKLLQNRNYSRRQQFEEIERSVLAPLPVLPNELKKQFHATVTKNGHVNLGPDRHYYSVPYRFIGKKIKLLYSSTSVEAFYHYERIAMHKRTRGLHLYTTEDDHLASTHQFVTEWSKEKFLGWASSIHEDVRLYIHHIFDRKRHPEQDYKSCLGILGFSRKVGNERLIMACRRGLSYGRYDYKTINTILERTWISMKTASLPGNYSCRSMTISEARTTTNNPLNNPYHEH